MYTYSGASDMELLTLSILLMAADRVRSLVHFGRGTQIITGFSTALLVALIMLPPDIVGISAVVAAIGTSVLEKSPLIKRTVNALSFMASSLAAAWWISAFGNTLSDIIAAGFVFEVINFTSIGLAYIFVEKMTPRELALEWPNTAYLALFAPIAAWVIASLLSTWPILFPLCAGMTVLFMRPVYFVFSDKLLLRGSWHTTPDTSESLSRLLPVHNHYV